MPPRHVTARAEDGRGGEEGNGLAQEEPLYHDGLMCKRRGTLESDGGAARPDL